jgi:hypothetical protein
MNDYTPPSINLTWGTPGDIEQTSDGGGEFASGFKLTDSGIAQVAKALGVERYLFAEFCRHENVPELGDRLHSAGEPSDLICLASPLHPAASANLGRGNAA